MLNAVLVRKEKGSADVEMSRSVKVTTSRSAGDIGPWLKRKAFKVSDQK
jgi:hypothetical protein